MSEQETNAAIGIIGGSGFYTFFESGAQEIAISTPYGEPSDKITIGKIHNHNVAFLPRHGKDHRFLPHTINYRANIWALGSLGVTRVISPCAVGSLQKHIAPGNFVICDQFVDWTDGRKSTFFDGPLCVHPSVADPYCPELRQIAINASKRNNIKVHESGTAVVINGPRFSTKAESKFFTAQGWDIINMSQFPEVYLAREMDMCAVTIGLVTDYDSGLVGDVPPVTHKEVIEVFNSNLENLKKVLLTMIEEIPCNRGYCSCCDTSKGL